MNSKMTKFIYGMLLGIATITAAQAADFLALDEAIPINSNAAKYAPVFDFDGDGCLPSAGISRDGQMNAGLRTTGSITGDCRSPDFLETSNTLHRSACVTSWGSTYCGHFYSLYFEKDQAADGSSAFGGHTHDWEHVAVWTTDDVITHVCASAHGDCVNWAVPHDLIHFEGDHVMIVYHKDGPTIPGYTHCFRFANSDDVATPENPYGSFVTPTLASWYDLTGDGISNMRMRIWLNSFDYGKASIPMKDSNFLGNLNNFKPSDYPAFEEIPDPPMDEDCYLTEPFSEEYGTDIDSYWGQRCSNGYVVKGIRCYGDYCDNKQLMCCRIPGLTLGGPETEEYSYWYSEENIPFASDDKAVVGMRCRESYCDGISLILRSAVGRTGGDWTPFFSDPVNGDCGSGYVAGVKCYGRYCDDLSLYCKEKLGRPSIYPLLLLDTK